MLPPPPPHRPATPAAGWYDDPWRQATWRWWDGRAWTGHTTATGRQKPRLPAWLSKPVVIALPLSVIAVVALAVIEPVAVALGLVPLFIVGPAMWWLDRIEPEPRTSKIHALLWGACVAALISVIVNTVVALAAGDAAAAVLSAPIVEELTKGAGVLYAVRRREVDGVMDGIVYAGWIALGFAVVEDFNYFAIANDGGVLFETFLLRAVFTPFVHPLFTAWVGLAVGLAVSQNRPARPAAWWGFVLAIATHTAWNGSLTIADADGGAVFLVLAAGAFFVLFIAAIVTVLRIRHTEKETFVASVPFLAERYGLAPADVAVFGNWKTLLATRRAIDRSERKRFDEVHRSLAQLAALHARDGASDTEAEQVIYAKLVAARST